MMKTQNSEELLPMRNIPIFLPKNLLLVINQLCSSRCKHVGRKT